MIVHMSNFGCDTKTLKCKPHNVFSAQTRLGQNLIIFTRNNQKKKIIWMFTAKDLNQINQIQR